MVIGPLLQHCEFEITYDPPVSRPLTLRASNRGQEPSCGVRPSGRGNVIMGTIISFPGVVHTARASRSIAGKSESAIVIILPVIRIERYVDESTGSFEPEASSRPRRRRPRPGTRS